MDDGRPQALTRLESEISVMMRRIKRVIAERADSVQQGLPVTSYLMLSQIAESGPVRASALADKFRMDKGATSRVIQHLRELGLLECAPDPSDGRATLLAVTGEGHGRLKRAQEARRCFVDERLSGWSVAEIDEFATLLGRYNGALS